VLLLLAALFLWAAGTNLVLPHHPLVVSFSSKSAQQYQPPPWKAAAWRWWLKQTLRIFNSWLMLQKQEMSASY
jgi:hypothetical protein